MEKKCSVIGCKILMDKTDVKLHRFPLMNSETLSLWKTATGQSMEYEPTQYNGLSDNHFEKTEYITNDKKDALKPTAIPTIKYCADFMGYSKKKSLNACIDAEQMEKSVKDKPENTKYQLTKDLCFKKMKTLKNKKQRCTKDNDLKLMNQKIRFLKDVKNIKSLLLEPLLFSVYVEDEMEKLKKHKEVYSTAKSQIKHVLKNGIHQFLGIEN
uniref:THAP-type domain-containing protein n=1 Tax=Schizaphis graminum TaxID=13262 RepID=A0A2S2PLA7_SCHGA